MVVIAISLAGAAIAIGLALIGNQALVETWLDRYGYFALFLILILEGAMLLYFAPSEALVPLAITLLADSPAEQALVVLVAVAGATVGQTGLFLLAKVGGREYVLDHPWIGISNDTLGRFERWFDRWGPIAVPISNALLFTRGMLTVPAGIGAMDTRWFVPLSALGSLVFQTWLALLAIELVNGGYFGGLL